MTTLPKDIAAARGTKVEKLPNPDDDLCVWDLLIKYQLPFTKYFGPKYAYGVVDFDWTGHDDFLQITARVKPVHQPIHGRTCKFDVPVKKFGVWRKNINLYEFIADK